MSPPEALEVKLHPAAALALRELAEREGRAEGEILRDAVQCMAFAHGGLPGEEWRKPRTQRRPAPWRDLMRVQAELEAERERVDEALRGLRSAMRAKARYRQHSGLWDAVLRGLVHVRPEPVSG